MFRGADGAIHVNAPRALLPLDRFRPHDYSLIPVEKYYALKGKRQLDYISSQGCNFRCAYCMPEEGMQWLPRTELLTYEELGLCAPGGQGALLRSGEVAMGGRRPVNPSGGLLSKGEPLGASAVGQVVELVHQLRGECGPRQVDRARVALAHTVGRGANASVVILSR